MSRMKCGTTAFWDAKYLVGTWLYCHEEALSGLLACRFAVCIKCEDSNTDLFATTGSYLYDLTQGSNRTEVYVAT